MNELEISYGLSKNQKIFSSIAGGYFALYGLYQCVLQALGGTFTYNFYLALIAVVVGVVVLLNAAVWSSKPMFKMNAESVYVNMPDIKSIYTAEWIVVKSISIGVSNLRFSETDGKDYNVEIGGLKYEDLKLVKSKIIELCESKNIPYRND